MSVETPRKPGRPRKEQQRADTIMLAAGKPWQREEDRELLRLREGTVDENGLRVIHYTKDDMASTNRAKRLEMTNLNYTCEETEDELIFRIPDKIFHSPEGVEGKQHAAHMARINAAARAAEKARDRQEGLGISAFEELAPVSADELMAEDENDTVE